MDPSFEVPEDQCYSDLVTRYQLLRDRQIPIRGRDILCLKINVTTTFKRPPRDGPSLRTRSFGFVTMGGVATSFSLLNINVTSSVNQLLGHMTSLGH